MKKWKCSVCGYIHEGDEPPDQCPVCGADKSKFVLLEPEIKEAPASQTPASEPAVEPPAPETAVKAESEAGKTLYTRITGLMTQYHAHPISVHVPNGVLPFSVLFAVIAVIFKSKSFAHAAHLNMIFVFLMMPAVLFSGYVDWQNRFSGKLTKVFIGKIICGATITGVALGLALWWSVDPDIFQTETFRRWLFLFFHILILCPAVIAGYLGGKLVFNKYE